MILIDIEPMYKGEISMLEHHLELAKNVDPADLQHTTTFSAQAFANHVLCAGMLENAIRWNQLKPQEIVDYLHGKAKCEDCACRDPIEDGFWCTLKGIEVPGDFFCGDFYAYENWSSANDSDKI